MYRKFPYRIQKHAMLVKSQIKVSFNVRQRGQMTIIKFSWSDQYNSRDFKMSLLDKAMSPRYNRSFTPLSTERYTLSGLFTGTWEFPNHHS